MNDRTHSSMPSGAARFIGKRVLRKEDRRLLTGRGTYTDDVTVPGMLHAAFVRSPAAKAKIGRVDASKARAVPGVRAVLTAKDLRPLAQPYLPTIMSAAQPPAYPLLAEGRVAYVGDAVAIVVADNRYIAEDGAGLVEVDYEIETPVVSIADARAGPLVHPDLGANLADSVLFDDPDIDAVFAKADYVVAETIRHQRQVHCPMEPKAIIVSPQGSGELVVYSACQGPHNVAQQVTNLFGLHDHHVKVLARDVGGAFGLKSQLGPNELAVVSAALTLGKPIKWIEDRLENLTSGQQSREQEITVRLAVSKEGVLLAADVDYALNVGAWPQYVDNGALAMSVFPGPYRLPRQRHRICTYYSNTAGNAPYRGPWMIETLAREVMIDRAAKAVGMDSIAFRRRNMITAADQPFTMVTGHVLDRISAAETLDLAVKKIDVPAFRAEQARARAEGRLLGLGFAAYVEPTTMAFPGLMGSEGAQVRIEPNGKVTAAMGSHSQGHSTATTMAQIVADRLGVDVENVTILEGDSTVGSFSFGAGASRQAVMTGGAITRATDRLAAKVKAVAGHMLNANPEHIRIENGRILVEGEPEVSSTIAEVARTAYLEPDRMPPDMELGLEAQARYRPDNAFTFANAAHACTVEVDPAMGVVRILRWVACEDCGVMINPMVVEGQIAGGVVQGIGGVMLEHAVYDEQGNPRAATFKDYLIPSVLDVPEIEYAHIETPSATEGGYKGVGEGGAIIAPPTLINAIHDALAPLGVACFDLPLNPPKLLAAIEAAAASRSPP